MAEQIGSPTNPLRVAIFGAGPAGFYAVAELLRQKECTVAVDLFDRLPTPYGLVRGGVAPDHQRIKAVIRQYEKTAGQPGFRFFGNVSFGSDLSLKDVLAHYHQVMFSTGAESERRLGIPGEDLAGSFPAKSFVGWYNGHPDYRDLQFDLSHVEQVAVIGNGNVAMDVTRILARSVEELATTDITSYALDTLGKSAVKEIYVLGRRGPAQAAFTNPEIRELTEIPNVDLVVHEPDLVLDEVNQEFLSQAPETHQRNVDILSEQLAKGEGSAGRKIRMRFFVSPVELLGTDKVEAVRIEKNQLVKDDQGNLRARGTGVYEEIPIQMIFRSVGYLGSPLPGIPFDERRGIIPNENGHVLNLGTQTAFRRVFVSGWIKRGPSGVIGTNKPDSVAAVNAMFAEVKQGILPDNLVADPNAIPTLLANKGVRYVTFADWKRLDEIEVEAGKPLGKPREKITVVQEMLEALEGTASS